MATAIRQRTSQSSVRNSPEYSIAPLVDRREMVEEAAYYLARKRGFVPGYELEDWFQAERQIDVQLSGH